MPLPDNTSLSLLGYSRPGDAVQSKPKQALIIRMSTETLDALESFPNHPQMEFELGANPRIYIGNTSFSMRHAREVALHELYLRASSITKKTAPLKLYANVVGKFTVERELHDDVCDRLRESTQDAVNQRMTRTTQFIKTPPDIQPNSKKRREPPPPSTMFRKPIRQSDKLVSTSGVSNMANAPNRTSTLTAQGSREGSMSLRNRVVHSLAIADRTEDELVRLVGGGADCNPSLRREIHDLLEQLATTSSDGPSSGNLPKSYRLKLMSWKEVRPFVWPKLSAAEQYTMARSARRALKDLGVAESDPAWDHIRNPAENNLREPQSASALDSVGLTLECSTKLETPKRGVSSQEVREKRAKQKLNPRTEIMMKDESLKANSRPNQAGARDAETPQMKRMHGTSRESLTTGRNQGGLSFKSAKYGLTRGDRDTSHTASAKSQNVMMQDDGSSLAGKFTAGDREVVRRPQGPDLSDSEREGRHLQPATDKARERAVGREGGSRVDDKSSLSKRKTTNRDDSEQLDPKSQLLPQKRRKTEPPTVHNLLSPSLPRDEKLTESLTPNKSNVEPRTRTSIATKDPPVLPSLTTIKKRKDSPGQPSKHGHHPKGKISMSSNIAPSSYPLPSNDEGLRARHGSSKIRRRSPIYTSSEDEELPSSNRVSSNSSSLATPSTLSHSHLPPSSESHTASRSLLSRTVLAEHAALRARYSTAYLEYLTSFQKLVMQRRMVDQMLKTSDSGSVDSVTDSDGEVELLQPEDLARLAADHRKRHEELVSIQQLFEKSSNVGSRM